MILRSLFITLLAAMLAACGPDEEEQVSTSKMGLDAASKAIADARGKRAQAKSTRPDWFPKQLTLPDDFQLLVERTVEADGKAHVLIGMTSQSLETLHETYSREAQARGFEPLEVQLAHDPSAPTIYFSGNGFEAIQIQIVEASAGKRQLMFTLTVK